MIHFNQVQRHYSLGFQTVPALRGVSGTIESGEMVGLCGPSGSGKSTLLNILGMLDTSYRGEVFLEGVGYPTHAKAAAQIRREKLGFIFQKFNLVPVMSALENVAFPLQLNGYSRKAQRSRAMDMLELVGLGDFAHHRPDHLSGGQQQRVAIARALVHNPAVVIADEPTASLDSETAQKVITLMRDLGHDMGTTFIVATHDPRMASRCDRVIELVDGLLVEGGAAGLHDERELAQGALSWVS